MYLLRLIPNNLSLESRRQTEFALLFKSTITLKCSVPESKLNSLLSTFGLTRDDLIWDRSVARIDVSRIDHIEQIKLEDYTQEYVIIITLENNEAFDLDLQALVLHLNKELALDLKEVGSFKFVSDITGDITFQVRPSVLIQHSYSLEIKPVNH